MGARLLEGCMMVERVRDGGMSQTVRNNVPSDAGLPGALFHDFEDRRRGEAPPEGPLREGDEQRIPASRRGTRESGIERGEICIDGFRRLRAERHFIPVRGLRVPEHQDAGVPAEISPGETGRFAAPERLVLERQEESAVAQTQERLFIPGGRHHQARDFCLLKPFRPGFVRDFVAPDQVKRALFKHLLSDRSLEKSPERGELAVHVGLGTAAAFGERVPVVHGKGSVEGLEIGEAFDARVLQEVPDGVGVSPAGRLGALFGEEILDRVGEIAEIEEFHNEKMA
jgi:hypothetical protein